VSRSKAIKVVAVVKDLFFVARIRETARLVGTELIFARTPEELAAGLEGEKPSLVIIDLTTTGWEYEAFFSGLEEKAPGVPLLGFTTHALARQTQPLHARCARVVTKETLTQELADILKQGLAA
jgi:DNA-binding NtrC family response regulator